MIMLLYNLFTFINIHEIPYLFYSLYLVAYSLWIIFVNGFGYQYLIPFNRFLSINGFLGAVYLTFLGLFGISFLNLKQMFRVPYYLFIGIVLFFLLYIALYPFLSRLTTHYIINAIAAPMGIIFLGTILYILIKGFIPARYFLAAYLCFLIPMFIWASRNLGQISENVFTQYSVYISSTLEIIFLSFALSDKMGIIKKEKEAAQQELIEQQKEALDAKTRMADSFARFVPREFLEFLNRPGIVDVELGDQIQINMSVLFSDIRSFTALSESMTPQETFNFINSYLEKIGPIIRSNNGFIDKYIGDAIMALFPGNPVDAVNAAIEMQHECARYNAMRAKAGYRDISIGVGIHTGTLILGTIGEKNRMETTVIADAVNLASRLESLTKMYGASIIISDDLLNRMKNPEDYRRRKLDCVIVKGKNEPTVIYEIFDAVDTEIAKLKSVGDYEHALEFYMNGHIADAFSLFRKIAETDRNDKAAFLFISRCELFLKNGIPEGWCGIERLDEK